MAHADAEKKVFTTKSTKSTKRIAQKGRRLQCFVIARLVRAIQLQQLKKMDRPHEAGDDQKYVKLRVIGNPFPSSFVLFVLFVVR